MYVYNNNAYNIIYYYVRVKLLFNAMNGIDRNETCWLKRARACGGVV